MSILIKGVNVPISCFDCLFCMQTLTEDGELGPRYCLIPSKEKTAVFNLANLERPENCPVTDAEETFMQHYIRGRKDERSIKEGES